MKHTEANTRQTDEEAIMATEKANITKAVVHAAAKSARLAVQAMAMASAENKGHRMWDPN